MTMLRVPLSLGPASRDHRLDKQPLGLSDLPRPRPGAPAYSTWGGPDPALALARIEATRNWAASAPPLAGRPSTTVDGRCPTSTSLVKTIERSTDHSIRRRLGRTGACTLTSHSTRLFSPYWPKSAPTQPQRVSHPRGGRVRGSAQHPDPAGVVLDHREYEHRCSCQGDRFEEITGQQGLCLGAQEVRPGRGRALGCGVDPQLPAGFPIPSTAPPSPRARAVHRAGTPLAGFSRARRSTRARIERTVRGRPGRLGRDRAACRLAIRSRCQRSTVSGRTSNRSLRSVCRGSRYSSAANKARSAVVKCTRCGPSWRSSMAI
jgi:hypothetical protein